MMDWLFRWRRHVRSPAHPFQAVDMTRLHQADVDHRQATTEAVRVAVNGIERQQATGLFERLLINSDRLRTLTNETIDRNKR